jgi:plasmid stabilization system protein ParE
MPIAVWTPKAERDLEDILYYIRVTDERPLTAQRIGQEIVAVADKQATLPVSGPPHPAVPSEWRYILHKRWLIFYQPHTQGIEVTRIIDASPDLPRAFGEAT